jgi:hypothetical protein
MEGQEVLERKHKEEEKRKRLLRVEDKKIMSRLKELGLEEHKKPTGICVYIYVYIYEYIYICIYI